MKLTQALQKMDLSEIEVDTYLALLKVAGAQPASILANRTGLNRTTTYKALVNLAKKGLVTKTLRHGIICFFAENPEEKLGKLLDEKKKAIEEANNIILEALPSLMIGETASPLLPKIRYYEGVEGIRQMNEYTLKEGVDCYIYGDISKFYKTLGDFAEDFIKKSRKLGIKVHAIMPYHKDNEKFYKNNQNELREVLYIPHDLFSIEGEVRIFGDKVGVLSLKKESLIGVIIDSESVAKMFKSIFMLTWNGYNKKTFKAQ